MRACILLGIALMAVFPAVVPAQERPNILVIWGDDIAYRSTGAYSDGTLAYETPGIDRIAKEGVRFTNHYGQPSCMAGRAAFITGQEPFRTGMTTARTPESGLQAEDPTLATILRATGYATGQFGKHDLGDKDEHLPTNHGFDEFFGNVQDVSADAAPGPTSRPRGVIHSYADGRIQDTGPLTAERVQALDDETLGMAIKFIDNAHAQDQPFFVWWNATRMHAATYQEEESDGVSEEGLYYYGMVEHDAHVGQLLDKLDELGIAGNTIVLYSTDNGMPAAAGSGGGAAPPRSKTTAKPESLFRVPALARWPDHFPAGSVVDGLMAHQDWFTTLAAAAGKPDVVMQLRDGQRFDGRRYKEHIDGLNFLPYLGGESETGPRSTYFYVGSGGDVTAVRVGDWKMEFKSQRGKGFDIRRESYTSSRAPQIYRVPQDPFEQAGLVSTSYDQWQIENPRSAALVFETLQEAAQSAEDFRPTRETEDLNLDKLVEQLRDQASH